MSYPKMNKSPRRTVGAPSLSGGMNLRDALNMCQDNQLTDSLNMWFKDGVLKTRAGRKNIVDYLHSSTAGDSNLSWTSREDRHRIHEEVVQVIDGTTYKLVSYLSVFKDYKEISLSGTEYSYTDYSRLFLLWLDENGNSMYGIEVGETFNYGDELCFTDKITNYFITATPKGVYLFVSGELTKEIYKYGGRWEKVPDEEIYAPLIATNLTASKHGSGAPLENGTMIEGYNLIGNRYKLQFSTVNKDMLDLTVPEDVHEMYYSVPSLTAVKDLIPSVLEVKITNNKGEIATHKATILMDYGEYKEEKINDTDGLQMNVKVDDLWSVIYFTNNDENTNGYGVVSARNYLENNMEMILPCESNREKVFSMTQSSWFGGASEGINGGTRLFLGGSTEIENKSLMLWSGLNEPLYFPENCEAYVGNSMSAVKGFGKQEDMLVIFKENEIYYTKYAQNTNIAAESLINQSVVDYRASSVYFPLVQISPVIGCLSADSIKLCRNRLVWLGQDKKVYTLAGASQYSERNVFCVSEMIDRSLKAESDLKTSYALDFDGHYMLIVGKKAYLMDYNSYGYQYAYSYQKTEDANIKIPWYLWDGITDEHSLLFNVGDVLCGITYKYATEQTLYNNSATKIELFKFIADSDDGKPIKSVAQTKFFDFGMPNHRKNIEFVGVTFGNNGGESITVRFLSESGEDYTTVSLYDDDTDSRNAGYIKSKILYPAIRSAVRFGVRFECEGDMAIEGLNITYRTLGGAR